MTSRRTFLRAAASAAALLGLSSRSAPALTRDAATNTPRKNARNVIFMVADGMNTASLCAARHYQKRILGRDNTWLSLYTERPAVRCAMETSSASGIVTDSSAASSSWGCGQRINNGTLNIHPEDGRKLATLFAKVRPQGFLTALVTTATATHATPAGFVAQTPLRNDEAGIARQYFDNRVDIVLGGGQKFFNTKLRDAFKAAGYALALDRAALLAAPQPAAPLLGLFANAHLPFTIDRDNSDALKQAVPTLAEMATAALTRLDALVAKRGAPGFVLQIEAARVDHAGHANDAATLIHDLLAFDETIAAVLRYVDTHPDTLLVVTTDHGCGGLNTNGIGGNYEKSSQAFDRLAGFKASYSELTTGARKVKSADLGDYLLKHTGLKLTGDALRGTAYALNAVRNYSADTMKGEQAALAKKGLGRLQDILGTKTGVGWTSGQHTGDLVELAALGNGASRFTPFLRNDQVHNLLLQALGLPTA
ncbi:MAG: alkaline phosphatase [Puniceicoccales bacterium]|jgi:alkaline phosphatase|nr:alkaline phosphatase [Puniceicoccales bacterium]